MTAAKKNNAPIIVITTTESRQEAEFLARSLIEARLAACVQIEEIYSFYRWEGAVESAAEYRLQIKSLHAYYPAIERLLKAQHSYALPEILALEALEVSDEYRRWIAEALQTP